MVGCAWVSRSVSCVLCGQQIYRLLKKHMEVVDSWEHKVDRLRDLL